MGINVQLRAENGEVLSEVFDSDMTLSGATKSHFLGTRLLKYLVPWGDAIFNQAQAADLSSDVAEIRQRNAGSALDVRLAEIQRLVDQLGAETHVYLWFVGD
jgi:hypothetical protein